MTDEEPAKGESEVAPEASEEPAVEAKEEPVVEDSAS